MTDTPAVVAAGPSRLPEAPLVQFHRTGSRYAIYPTAEHFNGRFGAPALMAALSERRIASQTVCIPLAVHVQIPFHDARHRGAPAHAVARHPERAAPYLDALEREATLVVEQIGACRSVSRLHLGGDSPAFLSDAQLARLMGLLRRNFFLLEDAEVAIELDPSAVDAQRLAHLLELGFEHVILVVRNAGPEALDHVVDLMSAARGLAFTSIDVELACDVPGPSRESWPSLLADVAALRPDRLTLHVGDRLQACERSERAADDEAGRAAFWSEASSCLGAAGYDCIGPGQFARHDDALAIARRDGSLHMTLQGCRARPDHDVLGLGASAVGRIGDCLYQNARTLPAYFAALENDRLPVAHGHVLDADDRLRGDVIVALACRGQVVFADILARHGIDMRSIFGAEITRLAPFAARGLVELHADRIDVTAAGRHVVDEIAAVFDRYLHERAGPGRPARAAR